jgi:hypothetical protein
MAEFKTVTRRRSSGSYKYNDEKDVSVSNVSNTSQVAQPKYEIPQNKTGGYVHRPINRYVWCGFTSPHHERWFAEYPNGKLVTVPSRVIEAEMKKQLFS